jgi:hypothetical protein
MALCGRGVRVGKVSSSHTVLVVVTHLGFVVFGNLGNLNGFFGELHVLLV